MKELLIRVFVHDAQELLFFEKILSSIVQLLHMMNDCMIHLYIEYPEYS